VNPRTAPLLLAAGVVLGSAFTLYAGVPAAALGGWLLVLAGAMALAKAADDGTTGGGGEARDGFRLAETGSVLGVGTSALLIGGVDHPSLVALGVVATGLALRGGAAALASAVPEAWRSAAGARISRFALAAVLLLGLAVVLDLAGSGPSWTPDLALVLRGVVMAAAVWLAAYAVAARTTLLRQVSPAAR
jgi:hypothetical protein